MPIQATVPHAPARLPWRGATLVRLGRRRRSQELPAAPNHYFAIPFLGRRGSHP